MKRTDEKRREEMTVEGNRKGVGLRERTEDRETRRDEKIRK